MSRQQLPAQQRLPRFQTSTQISLKTPIRNLMTQLNRWNLSPQDGANQPPTSVGVAAQRIDTVRRQRQHTKTERKREREKCWLLFHMATLLSFLSSPLPLQSSSSPHPQTTSPLQSRSLPLAFFHSSPSSPSLRFVTSAPRKPRTLIVFSSSNFDDVSSQPNSDSSKKSVLSNMIQEIEPLDVTLIQKEVPPTTLDAMKRTISSMLGLLPSDRFQVSIEALWEPLSKLLVSSMMTGYTLRNAEYRLCLERNLDMHDGNHESETPENSKYDLQQMLLNGLGEMSPEVLKYILHLQSSLSSVKKELCEVMRKSAALQMQQFVGEEKNDLLDYLRSLQPEKVAELSEPTCPELKETIHSVVHGLLATLSPKMHSKAPPPSESSSTGAINIGNEDCAELVENSLQFQPHISLTRDYLARLLFWCMLLGHYLRGLEYRMELMELLSLTSNSENDMRELEILNQAKALLAEDPDFKKAFQRNCKSSVYIPNAGTFLGVLCASIDSGLLKRGRQID
ncbi:hypothetical protein LWI28_029100 [Acer negundo]|uniref:Uncharacterized protein n=1 Tax=Acer negundo TaxID=4023 RepID=A0AAD5J1Z0_ACENE|nr:hypothetical protein LWI28_029100 [Acer negundo]